jgi:aconitate hydratase
LSQFALSRKDPEYVGRAKAIRELERQRRGGEEPVKEQEAGKELPGQAVLRAALETLEKTNPDYTEDNIGFGTVIYAVKPGDGSAREQAASCQKVLGGWANIAREYATKRYRSNLINWGMLPLLLPRETELPFEKTDMIFLPDIRKHVAAGDSQITAYVIKDGQKKPFVLEMGAMTEDERQIILDGCLMNYYKSQGSKTV